MKKSESPTKVYRLVMFAFAILLCHMTVNAKTTSRPTFDLTPIDSPLKLQYIPPQKGQANSAFKFYLGSFVNVLKPEVYLRFTKLYPNNNFPWKLIQLPAGLTPIYEGEQVCPESIFINASEHCLLRFSVEKNRYKPSPSSCYPVLTFANLGYRVCSQFDEVVARSPSPTQFLVDPIEQDGLRYDPATDSIVGTPTRTGSYHFTITATNDKVTTPPQSLDIEVAANLLDKPQFKPNYAIASATPGKEYHVNLMDLVQAKSSFGTTNQVHFRIESNHSRYYPEWVSLDSETQTQLKGHVPAHESGQVKHLRIIASSNTGGDSEPLDMRIPVAFDPAKKPVFKEGISLSGEAGAPFDDDLKPMIFDPAQEGTLQIMIDKVEPAAPWLSVSSATTLGGIVPRDATGRIYQVTLYANTTQGGNSEPVTIPLKISIDSNKTPHFYTDNPQLPLLYAGQPYSYDFASHRDIYPSFEDAPYTVELAEGYDNPTWLRIVENKILVDKVPEGLAPIQSMMITIKNTPGGRSEPLLVSLVIMN